MFCVMKSSLIFFLFSLLLIRGYSQVIEPDSTTRKNAIYLELAGRGYFSLNYERGWGQHVANRVSGGFGWNHHETKFTPEEMVEYQLEGDHEVLPYLSFYTQYSHLIGKKRSKLELGAGTILTFLDMARFRWATKLYETESYVNIYPVVGYRFEGYNGFLFMFTFNPIIQIPQGYFWPIPGFSFGYRF